MSKTSLNQLEIFQSRSDIPIVQYYFWVKYIFLFGVRSFLDPIEYDFKRPVSLRLTKDDRLAELDKYKTFKQ